MKPLLLKSYKLIFVSIGFLLFELIIMFQIFQYYQFIFSEINQMLQIFIYVLILVSLSLTVFIGILILMPQTILSHDEDYVYYHGLFNQTTTISKKDMTFISTRINIWAKPFLVYSALMIETKDKTHTIRFGKNMQDVKEQLALMIDRL